MYTYTACQESKGMAVCVPFALLLHHAYTAEGSLLLGE